MGGQPANTSTSCLRLFLVHIAFHVLVVAQNPPTLPSTVPVFLDMLEGSEAGTVTETTWFVPHKFHRLTQIEVHKNLAIGGFTATFEADPAHTSVGWDPIVQPFGNLGVGYTPQSNTNMNFANEITEAAFCVDNEHEFWVDLERLKFKETDGNEQESNSNWPYGCSGGIYDYNFVDLGGRLIGFRIRVSLNDYSEVMFDTVQSIQMIIDSDNCEEASFMPIPSTAPIADMTVEVNVSASTQSISHVYLGTIWGQTDCAFTATIQTTTGVLSYDHPSQMLSLESNDANEIGDFSISMVFSPNQYNTYVADDVYTFQVSVTCPVTAFDSTDTFADVEYQLAWDSPWTGNDFSSFSFTTLPIKCDCPDLVNYSVSATKDGVPGVQAIVTNTPEDDEDFVFYSVTPADAGIYVFTITADIPVEQTPGVNWQTTASFTLTAYDCSTVVISIQNAMLSSLSINFKIGSGQSSEFFAYSNLDIAPIPQGCPQMTYEVLTQTGGTIDSEVFTYSSVLEALDISSNDLLKAGTYPLRLYAYYDGIFINQAFLDFTVTLEDTCATTTLSIDPTVLLSLNLDYIVGQGPRTGTLDDSFVSASPTPLTACPDIIFSFDDRAGGPIDGSVFTYDPVTQDYTAETSDIMKDGIYLMRLIANYDGYVNQALLDVEIEVFADCATTTLTVDPSILTSLTLSYNIGGPTLLETLDFSLITASPTPSITCPNLVVSFDDQSGGPMFASAFAYDPSITQFAAFTATRSYAGVYPLRLIANYDGITTNTGSLNFQVTLVDTCETTTLTIDPLGLMLTSLTIVHAMADLPQQEVLHAGYVTALPTPLTSCPPIVFSVTTQSGLPYSDPPFEYQAGTGALIADTSDETFHGEHELRITAKFDGCSHDAQLDFTWTLTTPCSETVMSIDGSIFNSLSVSYLIGDALYFETLDDSLNIVTASPEPTSACPMLLFTFLNQDGTSIDSSVFSYTHDTLDGTRMFYVFTTDSSKASVYPLRLEVMFDTYTENATILDFDVTLVDSCATTTLTIDPTILTALTLEYRIGEMYHIEQLDESLVSASPPPLTACPNIVFAIEEQSGALIDPAVFTQTTYSCLDPLPCQRIDEPLVYEAYAYDQVTADALYNGRRCDFRGLDCNVVTFPAFIVYSTDLAMAATYPLIIIAHYDGYNLIHKTTLDFDVTLIDPCSTATLSIDSTILSSTSISYDIGYPMITETLDDTLGNKVTASPSITGVTCPPIVFSFKYQNGATMDSAVFTYTPATLEFDIFYDTDMSKVGVYSMRLIANFATYTNNDKLDFTVTLNDLCITSTLTIATAQFVSPVLYSVHKPADTQLLTVHEIIQSETVAPCGWYSKDVENQGGTPIDSTVFSETFSPWTFQTYTTDTSKIGTYNLVLKVKYNGAQYTYVAEHMFDLIIDDPCQAATLSITAPLINEITYEYTIGYGDRSIYYQQSDVASTETNCPLFFFEEVYYTGGTPDPTMFNYFPTTSTHQWLDQDDISKAGLWQFYISIRYEGDALHYTSEVRHYYDITITNPCLTATLSFDTANILSSYMYIDYKINYPVHQEVIDSIYVLSTETVASCPAFEYDFNDILNNPLDLSIFTFDGDRTLSVYNSDLANEGTYMIFLRAQYSGSYPSYFLNFGVILVDPCDTTVLTTSPSILSAPTIEYKIGYPAHIEVIDDSLVLFNIYSSICPALEFWFEDSGGGLADPLIFSYDPVSKEFSTYSDNLADEQTIQLRMGARFTGYSNTEYHDFEMNLLNPCKTSTLEIDARFVGEDGEAECENQGLDENLCEAVGCCEWDEDTSTCKSAVGQNVCVDSTPIIFPTPALSQVVNQPMNMISWEDADMWQSVTCISCGALIYSIAMKDSTPINSSIFDDTTDYNLSVYTDEIEQAGTYEFEITVHYEDYPYIKNTKSFVVDIPATCAPNTVTPSSIPSDDVYQIGKVPYETEQFDPFVISPWWCTFTYVTTVEPTPNIPSLIFYKGDSERSFAVYGVDTSLAGTYTITVDATDQNDTHYPGWSFELVVAENICLETTFSVSTFVFRSNPILYKIGGDMISEVVNENAITQNNPFVSNEATLNTVCPTLEYTMTGVKPPITWDNELTIQTNDTSYIGLSVELELTVKYAGSEYINTGQALILIQFTADEQWLATSEQNNEVKTLQVDRSTLNEVGKLTIDFDRFLSVSDVDFDRFLSVSDDQNSTDISWMVKLEVISFTYEPGEDEIKIANQTLISYKNKKIEVQVEFNHPHLLSLDRVRPEALKVTFLKQIASVDEYLLPIATELVIIIPPQFNQRELQEVQEFQEAIGSPAVTMTIVQLVLSVFAGAGVKHMWKAINVLQFIVYYPEWQIFIPQKARVFIVVLKNLAFFEFIQDFVKSLLQEYAVECTDSEEDSEDDSECQLITIQNGIGQGNFAQDAGVMLLGAFALAATLVGLALLIVIGKFSPSAAKMYIKVRNFLFWNTFIRYVLQSTLKLQIAACIALGLAFVPTPPDSVRRMLNSADDQEASENRLEMVALMVLLSFMPFIFIYSLYRHKDTLKTELTRNKIGSIYQTIQPTSKASLTYPIVFLLRRSIFVSLTFLSFSYPVVQVCLQIFLTVLYIIYIMTVPLYDGPLTRWMEMMNEVLFLLVNYHLIVFTQGWVTVNFDSATFIGFIATLITINFGLILGSTVLKIKQNMKLKKMKKNRKEILDKHDEAVQSLKEYYDFNAWCRSSQAEQNQRQRKLNNLQFQVLETTQNRLSRMSSQPLDKILDQELLTKSQLDSIFEDKKPDNLETVENYLFRTDSSTDPLSGLSQQEKYQKLLTYYIDNEKANKDANSQSIKVKRKSNNLENMTPIEAQTTHPRLVLYDKRQF